MEIEAVFDGAVFRPDVPPALPADAKVKLSVPPVPPSNRRVIGRPGSFLRAASEAGLEGPPDWSSNLDKYADGGPDV